MSLKLWFLGILSTVIQEFLTPKVSEMVGRGGYSMEISGPLKSNTFYKCTIIYIM